MLKKTIEIDGVAVTFKASAAIPRLYRGWFRRDIFKDLAQIQKSVQSSDDSDIPIEDLEMFENVAFIMAKHGDPENTPDDVNEWLDNFNTFSIYQVLPEILRLWGLNSETMSVGKKKSGRQPVR